MARAIFNEEVIAESEDTVMVEGNHYFPTAAVRPEVLVKSDHTTVCRWKGTASYYTVQVAGDRSADAAWYYPEPKEEASQIRDHIAFWKDVRVEG